MNIRILKIITDYNQSSTSAHLRQVHLLLVLFGRLLFVRYLKKAMSMQFAEAPRHLHMIYFSLSTLAEIEMIAMMTLEFCSEKLIFMLDLFYYN